LPNRTTCFLGAVSVAAAFPAGCGPAPSVDAVIATDAAMVELLSAINAGGSPLTPNVARTVMGMVRGAASGVRPPEDARFGGRGLRLVLS